MSRRKPRSGPGQGSAAPVVQLDLFAEQDQADTAAAAERQAAALLAAAGEEVIDTVTLAALCRVEAEALDARDRDDQQRFGRGGFFAEEARRVRAIAGWLDERGAHHEGRVPRAGVGWPCTRCDVAPGVMCGTRQHGDASGEGFVHCGRGWRIGFTSPGAGSTSSEDPGPEANPTAAAGCVPTCEDGPGGAWRGRCLGCGWRGPIRGRGTGGETGGESSGENRAVEDAHDHTHPGWRDLPVIDPQPNAGGDPPRAQSRAEQRWTAVAYAAAPEGWFEAGGPVRTRRERPGNRHVPGRAPGGGYDLAAASAPTGTQQDDGQQQDDQQGDQQGDDGEQCEGRGA